ncbi:hypothetical protein CEW46_23970 [Bacillus cereus]|nr:hypothetical protein CEW46_23970 [Bacillus cereus]
MTNVKIVQKPVELVIMDGRLTETRAYSYMKGTKMARKPVLHTHEGTTVMVGASWVGGYCTEVNMIIERYNELVKSETEINWTELTPVNFGKKDGTSSLHTRYQTGLITKNDKLLVKSLIVKLTEQ